MLALLGMDPERATVSGGNGDDHDLVALFLRLLDLPDPAILDVIVIVMGETLASGSAAVEAVGLTLGVDMADYWQADPAFFALVRDKQVLGAMVAEVAGETVAAANAKEKGATLEAHHRRSSGGRGRAHQGRALGAALDGVPAVRLHRAGRGRHGRAHARAEAARASAPSRKRCDDEPDPAAPASGGRLCDPGADGEPDRLAA